MQFIDIAHERAALLDHLYTSDQMSLLRGGGSHLSDVTQEGEVLQHRDPASIHRHILKQLVKVQLLYAINGYIFIWLYLYMVISFYGYIFIWNKLISQT